MAAKSKEYIDFLKTRISPNVKPEIAEMMIEYAMTPEEHERVYDHVRYYCFHKKHPVKNPKIFLVIAQTGGGKSGLTSHIIKNNPNTVIIDSDAFKCFNPRSEEISTKYPTLYGYLTGLDAYLHRDEAYAEALENGYNILIEIAPSSKERLFNINFEELQKHGYTIDANVLAVSKINSLLSIHERFEGQIEAGMTSPKLTDFKRANDSYDAVELVLKDLTELPGVSVSLWKRGTSAQKPNEIPLPELLTADKSNCIKLLSVARKADEQSTLQTAGSRIATIKSQMSRRKAPAEQKAQFAQIEEIVSHCNKYKS